jgi:hypothetical protein
MLTPNAMVFSLNAALPTSAAVVKAAGAGEPWYAAGKRINDAIIPFVY